MPERSWRALITPRRALGAVCLVFVVLSVSVAVATPWGEAHDEPDHVQNASTIASGSIYRMGPGVQLEAFQPPLYYFLLGAELRAMGLRADPGTWEHSGDREVVFRHDLRTDGANQRLFTMLRLPSILLGLTTVLLTAAIARRVSKDPWTPVVAAAVIALIPKFVFLSGAVNNDNLSFAVGAGATLVAVVLVGGDLGRNAQLGAAAGLGALAGLLAITKFSTLPLLAAWVVALVVARLHRRLVACGLFVAGFVVTSGWWFWWNVHHYGDPLAKRATTEHLDRFPYFDLTSPMTARRAFIDVPNDIWHQFFYTSGSNQFRWAVGWYLPFWLLLGIGLVGAALAARRVGWRPLVVLGAVAVLSLATVWIAVIDTTTIQTRHAFAGLPAIAVLTAVGYERLRLPVPARFVLPCLGLVGVVVALRHDVFDVFWT